MSSRSVFAGGKQLWCDERVNAAKTLQWMGNCLVLLMTKNCRCRYHNNIDKHTDQLHTSSAPDDGATPLQTEKHAE